MKRWMLVLAVLGAAAMLPMAGCGDDDDTDTMPDVRDDGRTDDGDVGTEDVTETETTPDVEDVTDVEPETDVPVDPCGASSCPNDPVDGPVGEPCLDDGDCESGFTCETERVALFDGEEYISWIGGYCDIGGFGAAGCDPDVADSCPAGGTCMYGGENPTTGQLYYFCLDACSVASSSGVPWTNNCDCRDGYECSLGAEVCVPGCSNDRSCCEIWHDGEGGGADGVRQAAEVTQLDASECTSVCDPCTYACTQPGCPGGACALGDTCEHDSDCPANAMCYDEFSYCEEGEPCWVPAGGWCSQQRCDLSGRECPTGTGCNNLGNDEDPFYLCITPCEVGTEPGDADYTCNDVGPAGPSEGDQACFPIFDPDADWIDGLGATGTCDGSLFMGRPGNWAGGTILLGGACDPLLEGDDCNSPFGLGTCTEFRDPLTSPSFCSASCNEAAAAAGVCETDATAGVATGVCWSGMCLEACETPNAVATAAATGCTIDGMACWPADAFLTPGYAYIADGETDPAGFCFPACLSDSWCGELFGTTGIPCDETSGVCDIFSK